MKLIFKGQQDRNFQEICQLAFNLVEKKCIKIIQDRNETIEKPYPWIIHVNLTNKLKTTGGRAYYNKNLIELNYKLLANNPSHIEQTFIHELAHLIADISSHSSSGRGHGQAWKNTMVKLGKKPERCHSMDTSSVQKRFTYECELCGKTYNLSTTRHNRLRKSSRYYRCKCQGFLSYQERG